MTRTRGEEALFASIRPKGGEKELLAFQGCCRDSGKAPRELPALNFFTPTAEGGELQIKSAFVSHAFVLFGLWS